MVRVVIYVKILELLIKADVLTWLNLESEHQFEQVVLVLKGWGEEVLVWGVEWQEVKEVKGCALFWLFGKQVEWRRGWFLYQALVEWT